MTLALRCALGHDEEFEMHVRAGSRNGLTAAGIGEMLPYTLVYAGLRAASSAYERADAVPGEERAL